MLGWSINLFRVRGIQLAVHFSFFLFLAVFALVGWSEGEWIGAAWYTAMLVAFFVCVTLHELGHCFTAMRVGVGVRRILLMPIGGMAEFDHVPRRPRYELQIALAGPLVNFVLAGLLWFFVEPSSEGIFSTTEYPATLDGFCQMLLAWNILMGCFNLLPIFPMDGGRVFRALLATRLPYVRATFVAATVGKVLASIAIAVALVVYGSEGVMIVALFSFILFTGELEYRAVKRQEENEAHWRATIERMELMTQRGASG